MYVCVWLIVYIYLVLCSPLAHFGLFFSRPTSLWHDVSLFDSLFVFLFCTRVHMQTLTQSTAAMYICTERRIAISRILDSCSSTATFPQLSESVAGLRAYGFLALATFIAPTLGLARLFFYCCTSLGRDSGRCAPPEK